MPLVANNMEPEDRSGSDRKRNIPESALERNTRLHGVRGWKANTDTQFVL